MTQLIVPESKTILSRFIVLVNGSCVKGFVVLHSILYPAVRSQNQPDGSDGRANSYAHNIVGIFLVQQPFTDVTSILNQMQIMSLCEQKDILDLEL